MKKDIATELERKTEQVTTQPLDAMRVGLLHWVRAEVTA